MIEKTVERDSQRSRVYRAEDKAAKSVGRTMYGQTIANGDLQAYVDSVLQHAAVQRRWGQRQIRVHLGRGSGYAEFGGRAIHLGTRARNEWFILHEVAHCLAPVTSVHGKEFAGVYLWLVQTFLGAEEAQALREHFRAERVKVSIGAVPRPTHSVVTKAARAAERTARKRERTAEERGREMYSIRPDVQRETARHLRNQIKHGVFGEPGSTTRKHALATARALEV